MLPQGEAIVMLGTGENQVRTRAQCITESRGVMMVMLWCGNQESMQKIGEVVPPATGSDTHGLQQQGGMVPTQQPQQVTQCLMACQWTLTALTDSRLLLSL
jgi:hypothetical protein